MALSDSEERILRAAGSDPSPVARLQAVGITLAKHGEDADASRDLLTQSYLTHTSPSFHLVPRGDSMFAEDAFTEAYAALAAGAVLAMMNRDLLTVPPRATTHFHSKLDKRDTVNGWPSVRDHIAGVPYSALLFQRYVGGVWRQVQDAYSEVKGDAVLEIPLQDLLDAHGVPYHRTKRGAPGAAETATRFGLKPGPDFVIPDDSPTLVIESKVAEDGGTARDNADMSAAPEGRHCRSRRTSRGRQRAHAPAPLMADGQACHPGQDGILRKRAPCRMPP